MWTSSSLLSRTLIAFALAGLLLTAAGCGPTATPSATGPSATPPADTKSKPKAPTPDPG
jgi:hypothetical protein